MEGRHDADPHHQRVHFPGKGAGAEAPPVGRLPAGPEGIWVCRKRAPGMGAQKRRAVYFFHPVSAAGLPARRPTGREANIRQLRRREKA